MVSYSLKLDTTANLPFLWTSTPICAHFVDEPRISTGASIQRHDKLKCVGHRLNAQNIPVGCGQSTRAASLPRVCHATSRRAPAHREADTLRCIATANPRRL